MTDKRCLVYETLGSVSNLQVSEAKGDGLMRLQGVFGVCGVKNQNNRVYDKDNYAQMVESLQKKIKESGCPGELEHPNSMNINLENVSHKIEDIQMNEDGTITGSIVLLNTPKGQIAKAIVEGGLPLFISSRGAGTITNEGRVTLSTIQTYDLVGTPGFSQAKLTLKTNQTLECLNEGLEDTNETWVIVEGEEPQDEPKNDDKPKEDPKEDDKPKEDPKEEPKKDDNKNNDNKDIDMKELKEAIDKLTEKVTSLEAELHVAQESLNEVKSIKPTNYEGIQKWITEEFAPEFQNKINEGLNTVITEKMNGNSSEEIQEAVKTWINDEFTSQMKSWVVEEFAPLVQDWIVEEFAPEVQNWVVEEFAPEVQNWVVEEYSPELQNWVTEEFAPEIQGWITEEFAPTMENWLMEEYTPEQSAIIEQKVNENVSAFMESQKAGRLDEIDGLLESIAAEGNTDVQKIVEEQNAENKYKGVYVVENMPAEYRPSWELLNEAAQQNIIRSSKMYDFTKEGVLESFWANIDFGKKSEEVKPVVESKNPVENYQNSIIANMKRLRGLNA
jgi:hypothetical protein